MYFGEKMSQNKFNRIKGIKTSLLYNLRLMESKVQILSQLLQPKLLNTSSSKHKI